MAIISNTRSTSNVLQTYVDSGNARQTANARCLLRHCFNAYNRAALLSRSWMANSNIPIDVMFLILGQTDPRSMMTIRVASYGAYEVVADFMSMAYTTRKLVASFIPELMATAFQRLQQSTGLLVSSSHGLGFIFHAYWSGADIDCFVNEQYLDAISDFLATTGYDSGSLLGPYNHVAPLPSSASVLICANAYSTMAISAVYEFFNKEDKDKEDIEKRKIQVILSIQSPMDVILGFHSTVPMNVVSHDKAICLYPKATFTYGLNFSKYDNQSPAVAGRIKYEKRGWVHVLDSRGRPDADLWDVERYVRDRHCWIIHLNTAFLPDHTCPSPIGHSWVLLYLHPDARWVTQYALLALPHTLSPFCASASVISRFDKEMVFWHNDDLSGFVKDLLDALPSNKSSVPLASGVIEVNQMASSASDPSPSVGFSLAPLNGGTQAGYDSFTNIPRSIVRPILCNLVSAFGIPEVVLSLSETSTQSASHLDVVTVAGMGSMTAYYYNFGNLPRFVFQPTIHGMFNAQDTVSTEPV